MLVRHVQGFLYLIIKTWGGGGGGQIEVAYSSESMAHNFKVLYNLLLM